MHRVKHNYKGGFAGALRPKNILTSGCYIEISTPMLFTGAMDNNKYLYDTSVEQKWMSDELHRNVKDNRLYARAKFLFYEGDNAGVEVFSDQFKIKATCIVKKL